MSHACLPADIFGAGEMSVINDMLNDLEQRTHPEGQTAGTDAEALHAVSPAATHTHSYWWLAGLGAFSVIAWFGWSVYWQGRTQSNPAQFPMQSPASISASVAPTAVSRPLIVDPVPVVEPEPGQASIVPPASNPILERIGLTDQGGLSGLQLEFNQSLPEPPLQYRRGDRLWLRLFSAEVSRIELPELTNDILINEWDAYIEDGYQMITLRVEQSIEAELIQVNPRRWRLNLQQATVREEPPPVASETLPADLPLFAAEVEKNSQIDAPVDSPEAQQEVLPMVKKSKTGYQVAEQALAAGRRGDAEIKLKEVLVKQPGHLQASLLLGRLYLQNGQPELAEPTVMAALQRYPEQTQLISYFTRSLLGQDRLYRGRAISISSHADRLCRTSGSDGVYPSTPRSPPGREPVLPAGIATKAQPDHMARRLGYFSRTSGGVDRRQASLSTFNGIRKTRQQITGLCGRSPATAGALRIDYGDTLQKNPPWRPAGR